MRKPTKRSKAFFTRLRAKLQAQEAAERKAQPTRCSLWVYYRGHDPITDAKIRRIVGRSEYGAGSDFRERDMSFEFARRSTAERALKRLRESGLKVRVQIDSWWD